MSDEAQTKCILCQIILRPKYISSPSDSVHSVFDEPFVPLHTTKVDRCACLRSVEEGWEVATRDLVANVPV